jgi:hypothetical protein
VSARSGQPILLQLMMVSMEVVMVMRAAADRTRNQTRNRTRYGIGAAGAPVSARGLRAPRDSRQT